MYLECEYYKEEYPSKRGKDRDVPILFLLGVYIRRDIIFRFQE